MKNRENLDPATEERRERARRFRREAYLKAKERRAKDPRVLAMKEALKQRRRELYEAAKERRRVALSEAKIREDLKRQQERATADFELMKLVRCAAKGSGAEN